MESAGLEGGRKIARIQALRAIARDKGWPEKYDFDLRATKEWVERNFADNGSGEIRLN